MSTGGCKVCSDSSSATSIRNRRIKDRITRPAKVLFDNAQARSKRYGTPFSITMADIVIPEVCPCCQKAFVFGAPTKYPVPQAPSLDRIDSDKGYVPGNVEVLCTRCNKLKGDGTISEFQMLVEYLFRR